MKAIPHHILVIGGRGGLGMGFVNALLRRYPQSTISATYFRSRPALDESRLHWHQLDVTDPEAVARLAAGFDELDCLINCVGVLHGADLQPEKSIQQIEKESVLSLVETNTLPTLLLARYFSAPLKRSKRPLFAVLSARVGSIEDNYLGGWYSYRLSKAALNMVLRTLSIEWKRTHKMGCVVALHPGTNDTALSQPFQKSVPEGSLFEPGQTAEQFLDLFERLDAAASGRFYTWDGRELPW